MRQNFLSIPFTPIVNLFNIVTFFLLAKRVLCTDSQYLACNPKSCGDGQIITFPFYIKNQQESFCGYPGFELSCNKNGQPVLQLPDNNDYIIQEIFYSNQSFRVSNAAFLDNKNSTTTATTCIPQIQKNMSFPEDRLKLSRDHTELLLIYNCNSSTLANDTELSKHKIIDCVGRSETGDSGIAMLEDDPLVGYASEKCRNLVVAPVALDSYRKERNVGIGRTLENGFLLDWIASDCSFCSQSGGRCGFDSGSYHFKCFCPDRPHGAGCISDCGECTASGGYCVFEEENGVCYCPDGTLRKHCNDGEGGNNTAKWLILAASVVGVGVPIIAVYYCCTRRLSSYKSKDDNSIEAFLKDNGSLAPKRYGYSEVKKMTQSFKDKLGQGGYGSVFKGKLPDGCLVAVKVLTNSKGNGAEFINEVASISRTSHVNIVTLLGFCFDGSKRILIYEFMPNGSLDKYIYKENAAIAGYQLDCEKLYQIALGVARGLEYLHRGCNTRILHFDIKPQNILLDENFCPKISDFGLAKICPKRESKISMIDARGTIGYIAPEVFCRNFGAVSHKSDVYSYGMLVLEMIGGRQNPNVVADDTSEMYFPEWIHKRLELGEELRLPGINSEEENNVARKMVLVSLWCIQTDPSNRPPVNGVVEMLQASLESLPIPPRPFLLSPATVPEISLASSQILSSELLEF